MYACLKAHFLENVLEMYFWQLIKAIPSVMFVWGPMKSEMKYIKKTCFNSYSCPGISLSENIGIIDSNGSSTVKFEGLGFYQLVDVIQVIFLISKAMEL